MKCSVAVSLVSAIVFSLCSLLMAADPVDSSLNLLTSQDDSGQLSGWKSFHEDGAATDKVWRLGDDGVLICKGLPKGYIYTEKDYGDFTLELEWRWPPDGEPGNGGVLLRTTGKHKIWPKCLEAQINAGDAGDFWGLGGYELSGPAERSKSLEHPQFGKLTNVKKSEPAEKPAGQWNRYKIVADGDTVTLIINGRQVNQATGCETTPGKILLTSEGNEIHFRNVRLTTR